MSTPTFHSPMARVDPPYVQDVADSLAAWLDYERATILRKLDGLDDAALRRPMVPSGTCLLGLVKHLTEVEHGWFVNGVGQAGEPPPYSTDDDPDADFHLGPDESTQDVVSAYLAVCERSRMVLADVSSLDQTYDSARHNTIDVRWVATHMIEETARHNGQADILRELIDGTVGE